MIVWLFIYSTSVFISICCKESSELLNKRRIDDYVLRAVFRILFSSPIFFPEKQ